jgi:hypothetical protein
MQPSGALAWLALASVGILVALPAAPARAGDYVGNWYVEAQAATAGGVRGEAFLMARDGSTLVLACDPTGLSEEVTYLDAFPAGSATVPVVWRTDRGPAHRQVWTVGGDRGSMSPQGAGAGGAFLKSLSRAQTLVVAAAGRRSTFELEGVREVARLLGACETSAR